MHTLLFPIWTYGQTIWKEIEEQYYGDTEKRILRTKKIIIRSNIYQHKKIAYEV